MSVHSKICGLTNVEAVAAAVESGSRYLGFVFYPASPRHVTPQQAARITRSKPDAVRTVAVIVDMTDEALDAILKEFQPDMLQLHGNEKPERVRAIKERYGLPVIKALKIRTGSDVGACRVFYKVADMLLFDARPPEGKLPGGNGVAFDWALLKEREFPLPWFLSGGLSAANVTEAVKITGATLVDVSSSLEIAPGIKDPELILQFNKVVASL